ncbi:hypothetical protein EV426DRAFT_582699 [Tirmania nivea]|nr:hypothetical protein EV426DRAFT_582699 [Tirmania nivea]
MTHNLPTRPLKSTAANYTYPRPGGSPVPAAQASLPPGWTEHKAPTGHSYYYHATTKTSTYTRPVPPQAAPVPHHTPAHASPSQFPFAAAVLRGNQIPGGPFTHGVPTTPNHSHYPHQQPFPRGRGGGRSFQPHRPPQKPDRPKKKRSLPGVENWVLVLTKWGREFVHNLETKESLWLGKGKVPEKVVKAVERLKALEPEELAKVDEEEKRASEARRRTRRAEKGKARAVTEFEKEGKEESEYEEYEEGEGAEDKEGEGAEDGEGEGAENGESAGTGAAGGEPRGRKRSASAAELGDRDREGEEGEEEYDEEYEEDEEQPEGAPKWDGGQPSAGGGGVPSGPVEFTEEDIAWQLEAMAEEYGLEEEDLQEEDLPAEDAVQIFREMLEELQPNPYGTWENTYPSLAHDPRYAVLNTTKHRQEVFTTWCKDRIAILKEEKLKQERKDPKVQYWEFLTAHVKEVKKFYWPEFKRKHKKEKEMKDPKITDKDREKMYREYAAHNKLSPALLENELKKLLKSNKELTRNTKVDQLPLTILTDVRYAAYPLPPPGDTKSSGIPLPRDTVIQAYLFNLPEEAKPLSDKELKERQREEALRERERAVRREQGRLRGEIEKGREMLKGEEMEIERAVKEVGRKGLLNAIEAEREREKESERKE